MTLPIEVARTMLRGEPCPVEHVDALLDLLDKCHTQLHGAPFKPAERARLRVLLTGAEGAPVDGAET